jgi:hypothetical protein
MKILNLENPSATSKTLRIPSDKSTTNYPPDNKKVDPSPVTDPISWTNKTSTISKDNLLKARILKCMEIVIKKIISQVREFL